MNIKCIWYIMLPFKFNVEDGMEIKEFEINGVYITPIKTKDSNCYNSLKVEYPTEIDDSLLPKDMYNNLKNIEFKTNVGKRAGTAVKKFVNSYYRCVEKNIINQVFNGYDFITHYQMIIVDEYDRPIDSILVGNSAVRVLTKSVIDRITNDINRRDLNIVEEFMRMALCFLENGYFDMAIMNLSMALETTVKTYVFAKGISVQDLSEKKGYIDKFFHLGLKKAKGKSLLEEEPEYFCIVSYITDLRNEIAHGNSLYNINNFMELSEDEIFGQIEDLIDYGEEIIDWIKN